MMGESYHNNHHKFGSRANFGGIRWHEIDPTYLIIRVLDKIGVIRLAQQKEVTLERMKKAA
jgi:stearoyl-CoA desaturase (delta-9 desaturase)